MKAADVMTKDVVTATPETSIEEAVRLMLQHGVSGLPVVDDAGAVVGIVTEGDLLRRAETGTEREHSRWLQFLIAPGRLAEEYAHSHARKVGEVMTGAVVSVALETPLAEVVALVESRRIKRLPVIDKGRLAGIISRADLLSALADLLPKTAAGPISDADIRRRVLAEIDKQPWAPRGAIDAAVQNGIVDLRGVIRDERVRAGLRVAAENVPGVKLVQDHLVDIEILEGEVVEVLAASPDTSGATRKDK